MQNVSFSSVLHGAGDLRRRAGLFRLAVGSALFALAIFGVPDRGMAQLPGEVSASAAARAAAARPEPGDRLVLKVWREPELQDTALIGDRGDVILPKIGVVNVSGHSIGTLQDTIRARYSKFLRDPGIDVQVLRRISVNGEVGRPDVYHVDVAMTLRDVVALAGGITSLGNPNSVWLVRDGVRTRVANWDSDQTVASDLRSGDQVVVSRRSWLHQNAISVATVGVMVASIVISVVK